MENRIRRQGDEVVHYVITRINTSHYHGINLSTDWAEKRSRLFKENTFSSISRQTETRFRWLLFFDDDTPEDLFTEVLEMGEKAGAYVIWNKGKFTSDSVSQAISNQHWGEKEPPEWILTTRLDSDDIVCDDFFKLVRSEFELNRRSDNNFSIELTNGVVYWEEMSHACSSENLSSDFITYAERYDESKPLITCYGLGGRYVRSEQRRTRAAWCKMVHDANGIYSVKPDRSWPKVPMDVMKERFHLQLG